MNSLYKLRLLYYKLELIYAIKSERNQLNIKQSNSFTQIMFLYTTVAQREGTRPGSQNKNDSTIFQTKFIVMLQTRS